MQLLGYSSLSRPEELALLALAVEGKLILWQALEHASVRERRREIDFERLIARARSQQRRLQRYRLVAAAAL